MDHLLQPQHKDLPEKNKYFQQKYMRSQISQKIKIRDFISLERSSTK